VGVRHHAYGSLDFPVKRRVLLEILADSCYIFGSGGGVSAECRALNYRHIFGNARKEKQVVAPLPA
jgi:hypothetical protein